MLSRPAAVCAAVPQVALLPGNSVRWPVAAMLVLSVTVTVPAAGAVLTMLRAEAACAPPATHRANRALRSRRGFRIFLNIGSPLMAGHGVGVTGGSSHSRGSGVGERI